MRKEQREWQGEIGRRKKKGKGSTIEKWKGKVEEREKGEAADEITEGERKGAGEPEGRAVECVHVEVL